jgi:hypothetical protein
MNGSDPREMLHAVQQWPADKPFGQQLLPVPSGMSASMQSNSCRPTGKPTGDSPPPPMPSGGHQHGYPHSAPHRPPQAACDSGMVDLPASGGGGGSCGGARPAPEAAVDALPSCSICPHRMTDILLYSWSNVWSLHNLR